MSLWLFMALLFWLLIIACMLFRKDLNMIFAFFDGLLLAFLCFKLLPEAFLQVAFWPGVLGLLFGALAGSAMEGLHYFQTMMKSPIWHSTVFSATMLYFWKDMPSFFEYTVISTTLSAFIGGFFLAVACGGILPEQESTKIKAITGILGAAGFMIGTCYLYVI